MITLKEIAAEAGVSVMTVSNVIHKNYARVSPATVEKVQSIIESRLRHIIGQELTIRARICNELALI